MLDIPSISGIIAALGVIVGVVFAVLQLRDLVKTRHTELIMRLYSDYRSNEFREALIKVMNLQFEDYEDYVKKYGPWFSDEPAHKAMAMVAMFFEGIGILLYKKLIDASLTYDLFTPSFKLFWEKMKPVILGLREQTNEPKVFEWFEYLYNEMRKREQQLAKIQ